MLFYIRDVFLSIFWGIREERLDLLICFDNLNTFSGYFLKLLGRVDKLVFYTIDYVPKRFSSRLLNNIYHWFDRFAVTKADVVWNVSARIVEAREKSGIERRLKAKQIEVPIGIENYPKLKPINRIDKFKIAFVGHLREHQGLKMLIDSMKVIVKKLPKARLLIIGGGPLEAELRKQVERLKLNNNIKFTGYIDDFASVEKLLVNSAIGVAPYTDDNETFTRFADPAKPKDYLACGLPVVITNVPGIAEIIEENKCGIVIRDNKKDLADAIITLLTNDRIFRLYRKNSIRLAKRYSATCIFDAALRKTL